MISAFCPPINEALNVLYRIMILVEQQVDVAITIYIPAGNELDRPLAGYINVGPSVIKTAL